MSGAVEITDLMRRLREDLPAAGFPATVTDIGDTLILTGGDDNMLWVAVRPSNRTEAFEVLLEIRCAATGDYQLPTAGAARIDELSASVRRWW